MLFFWLGRCSGRKEGKHTTKNKRKNTEKTFTTTTTQTKTKEDAIQTNQPVKQRDSDQQRKKNELHFCEGKCSAMRINNNKFREAKKKRNVGASNAFKDSCDVYTFGGMK